MQVGKFIKQDNTKSDIYWSRNYNQVFVYDSISDRMVSFDIKDLSEDELRPALTMIGQAKLDLIVSEGILEKKLGIGRKLLSTCGKCEKNMESMSNEDEDSHD